MPSIRSDLARATASPSRAGFSLLEVLAALVVTMLLVLALTPFTGQMLATWTRGSEVARLVEIVTRGMGVLRRDLRHAVVWAGRGAEANAEAFAGDEVSLSFLAATGLDREGIQMISIAVETSEDGRALVRRSAPLAGSAPAAFTAPVVLFSGPFSYRFRYVSRGGQERPAWTSPHELPARVELAIVGRNGPVFRAPLEFPVLASLSAACFTAKDIPGCPNTQQQQEDVSAWMQGFGYTGDN